MQHQRSETQAVPKIENAAQDRYAIIVPDFRNALTVRVVIETTWGRLRTSAFLSTETSPTSPTVFIKWMPNFRLPVRNSLTGAVCDIEYVHLRGTLTVCDDPTKPRPRKYKLHNMQPLDEDEDAQVPADGALVVASFEYRSSESTTGQAVTIAVVPLAPLGYLDTTTRLVTTEFPEQSGLCRPVLAVRAHPVATQTDPEPEPPVAAVAVVPAASASVVKQEAQARQLQLPLGPVLAAIAKPQAKILDIVTYDNSTTVTIAVVSAYNSGSVAWPQKKACLGVVHPSGTKSRLDSRPRNDRVVQPGEGYTFTVALTLKAMGDAGRHGFFVQLEDGSESATHQLLVDFPDCCGRGYGKRKLTKQEQQTLVDWMQQRASTPVEDAYVEAAAVGALDKTIQDKLTHKEFVSLWPTASGAKRRRLEQ